MKKQVLSICCATVVILGIHSPASATLMNLGSGLIYDTTNDVTWLQDANYSLSSGYDTDGLLTWWQADEWASNLVYENYSNWRLPELVEISSLYSVDGVNTTFFAPFNNLQSTHYWSSTVYDQQTMWVMPFNHGILHAHNVLTELSAWAVHDGKLAPVPEPATMLLLGTGIVGLAGSRIRRKKK